MFICKSLEAKTDDVEKMMTESLKQGMYNPFPLLFNCDH